jgi:shikimate dehydrogenase
MKKFGLIGYPLGHSFSQKYFTDKFHREHIQGCSYENFPINDINRLIDLLKKEPDLAGLNVTIPHKSDVIRFLDNISPEAAEIGAVNVVKIRHENDRTSLSGFNSDVYGFTESILPQLENNSGNALVLGTGGSSRAVCFALNKIGMRVTLVSRKHKPGLISYYDIDHDLMKKTDLIINTTPLGMYPDIDSKPELDYDLLGPRHILYDLVYNPEQTAFLKEGKERGCITVSGMRMLHLQAERSWEIWNDDSI